MIFQVCSAYSVYCTCGNIKTQASNVDCKTNTGMGKSCRVKNRTICFVIAKEDAQGPPEDSWETCSKYKGK